MDAFIFFLQDQNICSFSNISIHLSDNMQVQVRILKGHANYLHVISNLYKFSIFKYH